MLLVGNSGAGKSIAVDSISRIPKVYHIDKFEGLAGMMSGTGKKEKAKSATGGWLLELGERGLIACKEFTSTLAQPKDKLMDSIGALRIVADGELDRTLGTDGGVRLQWHGSVGFVGASTSALDDFATVLGEFGQRWVVYRYNEDSGYESGMRILATKNHIEAMFRIKEITAHLFESLSLEWGCYFNCADAGKEGHRCSEGPTKRQLTVKESHRIIALATVAARARSIVPRSERNNDILNPARLESPNRIVGALGQLFLGLEVLGLDEEERWHLIRKIAWDSITPQMRSMVLMVLAGLFKNGQEPKLLLKDVESILKVSPLPARRVVEDMAVLGLVECSKGRGEVVLTEWSKEEFRKGNK